MQLVELQVFATKIQSSWPVSDVGHELLLSVEARAHRPAEHRLFAAPIFDLLTADRRPPTAEFGTKPSKLQTNADRSCGTDQPAT
jgi:hypothetical protein